MKWRLVGAFVSVMAVVLLAVEVPLARHLREVERERFVAELQRDAFLLAGTAEDVLSDGTADSDPSLRSSVDVYASNDGARVVITDETGITVVSSQGADTPVGDASRSAEVASALAGVPVAGRDDEVFVLVPVRSGASVVGTVQVAYPAAAVDERADDKLGGLLIVGLISLAAAAIAALFMASTIAAPLRRLQRATERIAAGDLTSRADIDKGPPEVRSLSMAFDTMTARVAELVDQQRSFASDASHQLRTPLTALRLQLERASDLLPHDPDGAGERVEAACAETERLQRMVDALLLLARTEQRVETVAVNLARLTRERADIWRPLAEEREVRIDTALADQLVAIAVPGAVEQIIDNYIDNALSAAPAGTTIEIAAGTTDGWAEVHVMDRGPGLTGEQCAHAFDRFWRGSAATHDGSGLGLAIVRHLATASGGQVALSERLPSGIDATLRLRPAQWVDLAAEDR